jgi:hypothetical protein
VEERAKAKEKEDISYKLEQLPGFEAIKRDRKKDRKKERKKELLMQELTKRQRRTIGLAQQQAAQKAREEEKVQTGQHKIDVSSLPKKKKKKREGKKVFLLWKKWSLNYILSVRVPNSQKCEKTKNR